MNTDELIEQIHNKNAECRSKEQYTARRPLARSLWRIAVPAAAAAAILLMVLLPHEEWPSIAIVIFFILTF